MTRRSLRFVGTAAACLLGWASGARAVDGVIEMNDASILAAGGYPGQIALPGSYVLTGNLTPPPGKDGIQVFASDVTLDLNGFAIFGSGANGIVGLGGGLTVRNGTVGGFSSGVNAGTSSRVYQVRATFNTGTGISGFRCVIVESIAENNGTGIQADRCKVENSVVSGSSGPGIVGNQIVIVHNNILSNTGGGILTPGGSTIQENSIQDNGTFGISDGVFGPPPTPPPATPGRLDIRGNVISNNGGAAGGPGISLILPALITENTISGSTGSGIACGSGCVVNGNSINSNNTLGLPGSGGVALGAGSNASDNSISFNTGFGINLPITSGYSQNTLNANAGPDMLRSPVPGAHPTSGFHNLCSGIAGPAPTCP